MLRQDCRNYIMTQPRKPTTGPLQGIRILDLTRLLPGPLATMLMADMGAEVIKIEDPNAPDYVRAFPPYQNGESLSYLSLNRSKRSILLDYRSDEGRAAFFELVKTADVVMEQFRPGFLDNLGLGYEAARAHNPEIIYVSVTGYGQTGPYAHLAGHDINYVGLAGILGMTGNADELPIQSGAQLADIAGGSYMAVIGTLSALMARQKQGMGQHVDVSMTDGAMPLLQSVFAMHVGQMAEAVRGAAPLSGGLPNYGVYPCQDGRYVALGTLESKFWAKFCRLIGKPDWVSFMAPQNPAQRDEYKRQITSLFVTRTQADWVTFGTENDLLITPILDLADLAQDPHLTARQMILTETHAVAGDYQTIGIPIKFSATPAHPSWPAPLLGEDTDSVLD
jgi:alpha-methylacyl-CoA racemase